MDNQTMKYVYLSMAGEEQQGGPGCTYVDADKGEARYVRTCDMQPAGFKEKLAALQEEEENKSYFVVTKAGLNLHVFQVEKEKAKNQDWKAFVEANVKT